MENHQLCELSPKKECFSSISTYFNWLKELNVLAEDLFKALT